MPALRESYSAVVARADTIINGYVTEPYEAGWASEAIVFAQDAGGGPAVALHVQISADGINWLDEGSRLEIASDMPGAFARVNHFGNWLRLRAEVPGRGSRRLTLTFHFKA